MRTVGAASSRWLHFFSPAGIERYFREREHLRAQGASADQLRALSERYGASATHVSGAAGPAYASLGGTRRDGIIVTGQDTRNAYALAERVALPEQDHQHADQEEAFYVISGDLAVEVEGVNVTAPAGSFVLVPRGLRRRHIARAGTTILAIFSPGSSVPH
jgi:mannose-6-phosphate isomerase-like protein (cupin superfamily)